MKPLRTTGTVEKITGGQANTLFWANTSVTGTPMEPSYMYLFDVATGDWLYAHAKIKHMTLLKECEAIQNAEI